VAQRNSFKSNSSFFRMLAVGAVGAQAVQKEFAKLGHSLVELERGSLSTRIWRDVKRKRVRIPDLCCTLCGVRIESRAKTAPDLSMSHSPSVAERAWHYGMLNEDLVAFPIVEPTETVWSDGGLRDLRSMWRERTVTTWRLAGYVNVFTVDAFKAVAPKQKEAKGVSEGSEVQVQWKAKFAPWHGSIINTTKNRVSYTQDGGPPIKRFLLGVDERAFLKAGDEFDWNQVVAGQVAPVPRSLLACKGGCGAEEVDAMMHSRERTVRFTGAKLARIGKHSTLAKTVRELADDPAEDPYVRMEARCFMCVVAGESADAQFRATLLEDTDAQMRLEAAVTLAETHTPSAFDLLRCVLHDPAQPLFLRSACAWAIGCHGTQQAAECLVQAFGDVALEIRDEALTAVADLGAVAAVPLVQSLSASSNMIAAGAAESLRRIANVPAKDIASLAESSKSTWPAWTLAHLPRDTVQPLIAALQSRRPDVHFAVSVLWSFLDSWIADTWTPRATP